MIDTNDIVRKLKPLDPEKIILFGSFTKGHSDSTSDIDVLIIKKTKKKPSERIAEALKFIWGSVPHIEPQIMTPSEFNKAIAENRFFIMHEILRYGKTIYEKKN